MKLFVDDERQPPTGEDWVLAKTVNDAVRLLASFDFTEVSFDHDDGSDSFEAVAYFLCMKVKATRALNPEYAQPKVYIHSANPVGAERLQEIFDDYHIESVIR